MSDYAESDLPIARARERQLIEEAERAAIHRVAVVNLEHLHQWAAWRAKTRERIAGTVSRTSPDSTKGTGGRE